MPIDAQRLDALLAELVRQNAVLRERVAAATTVQEVRALMTAQLGSSVDPDAARLRVMVSRLKLEQSLGRAAVAAQPLPPHMRMTGEEMEVVRARLPEVEAVVVEGHQMLAEAMQRIALAEAEAAGPPSPAMAARVAETLRLRDEDPEAGQWLRDNPGDAPLAANQFEAEDAREFVASLYAAGAQRVVIASECIRDEKPPYADGIRVVLPADPAKRAALFAILNAEGEEQGFDPEEDTGQPVLFMWWD